MEKAFAVQRAARENVNDLKTYFTDLNNWEKEMKRKEAALRGETEQVLPPVRSKLKKEKPTAQAGQKKAPRILAEDYKAWDKFDVDAACEDVDMSGVGPTSLDARRSETDKLAKLREEAQYEKNRGNDFVKQSKWDKAIECYNRAIELVDNDAIYFANRGLCHLMKERLHLAESDCTAALKLDPSYVKAYQRRAAAREKLGSLRAASQDLRSVLELEPNNTAARKLLQTLKERMATKGGKFKSSPASTPTETRSGDILTRPKIVELTEQPIIQEVSTKMISTASERQDVDEWKGGTRDGAQAVHPIQKPPHLRSKKPLRLIPIEEIPIGETEPRKSSHLKIIEISPDQGKGDSVITSETKHKDTSNKSDISSPKESEYKSYLPSPIESSKLNAESIAKERNNNIDTYKLAPPTTCVQFTAEWKSWRNNETARVAYLSVIDPQKLPAIFQNSLESEVLSEMLRALASDPSAFREKRVGAYLSAFTQVKRFGALAMFLSAKDKEVVKSLLQHCKDIEGCSDEEIIGLRNKFEL